MEGWNQSIFVDGEKVTSYFEEGSSTVRFSVVRKSGRASKGAIRVDHQWNPHMFAETLKGGKIDDVLKAGKVVGTTLCFGIHSVELVEADISMEEATLYALEQLVHAQGAELARMREVLASDALLRVLFDSGWIDVNDSRQQVMVEHNCGSRVTTVACHLRRKGDPAVSVVTDNSDARAEGFVGAALWFDETHVGYRTCSTYHGRQFYWLPHTPGDSWVASPGTKYEVRLLAFGRAP